jgi:RimJ/RimL family protein N-acetyltransferase
MVIRTPRLVLSVLGPDDLHGFHGYRCLPEVARFQGFAPTQPEESADFLERVALARWNQVGCWYQLGIRLDGALVGDLGVHFAEEEQCAFGVTLSPGRQGQGYATEAMQAVLSSLFDDLGKHRVHASVDPRNTPSVALMRRLGFRMEAHHVQSYQDGEGWADDLVFALLGREWAAAAQSPESPAKQSPSGWPPS